MIDFDYISESLLPNQCPKAGAPLAVGQMAYDTLIVPGCETLRSSTVERLEALPMPAASSSSPAASRPWWTPFPPIGFSGWPAAPSA